MTKDKRSRSVAKGISWRIIASITTVAIVYFTTSELELAATVGMFDVVLKLIFYYMHERAWGSVVWGSK